MDSVPGVAAGRHYVAVSDVTPLAALHDVNLRAGALQEVAIGQDVRQWLALAYPSQHRVRYQVDVTGTKPHACEGSWVGYMPPQAVPHNVDLRAGTLQQDVAGGNEHWARRRRERSAGGNGVEPRIRQVMDAVPTVTAALQHFAAGNVAFLSALHHVDLRAGALQEVAIVQEVQQRVALGDAA